MGHRQRHDERGRLAPGLLLAVISPWWYSDNFSRDGQSHARAFIFIARVQPLKHVENPVQIFFVKADAVVTDRQLTKFLRDLSASRPAKDR